jgi:hypothetical protein
VLIGTGLLRRITAPLREFVGCREFVDAPAQALDFVRQTIQPLQHLGGFAFGKDAWGHAGFTARGEHSAIARLSRLYRGECVRNPVGR